MRTRTLLLSLPLVALGSLVAGRRLVTWSNPPLVQFPPARALADRSPIMSTDDILPKSPIDNPVSRQSPGGQILIDLLPRSRNISIFATLLRDSSYVVRLADRDQATTVLAPSNGAMQSLDHKPWEDPKEYAQIGVDAYEGSAGAERARRNLQHFVTRHTVNTSPWLEGQANRVDLLGKKVWWETKDKKRVIMPDQVEVDCIAATASNGEIWILKGILGE